MSEKDKYNSTVIDSELFDDESYIPHPVLSVRRIALPHGGEDWEILSDNRVEFVIKGIKLTKKQREFLKTVAGFNLLLTEFKMGKISINKLKTLINQNL